MNSKIKKTMWITIAIISGIVSILYVMGTNKIQTKSELIIDKNIDSVLDVMGNQFTEVHVWSSNFSKSKPEGNPKLPTVNYLHRSTITERGITLQELDEFSLENHSLKYHISKGAPSIAKKASAHWHLESAKDGKTKVIIEFFIETKGFKGRLLSILINKKIGASGNLIAEELKYYIEQGKPLPNNK